MGEARRKKLHAADEDRLWQALEAQSVRLDSMPRDECVQMLVVSLEHREDAILALGSLPALCTEFLNAAVAQKATSAPDNMPEAVCWERWPSGRQNARISSKLDVFRASYPTLAYYNAGARGYGVQLAAFPPNGWAESVQQAHDDCAPRVEDVTAFMNESPRIQHASPQPNYTEITIPTIENDGMRAGMVAQTLRILDSMAATRESLRHNFGCLRLRFEGYDDDPRQVWDVEQNAEFLRDIATQAPWWAWLMAPEQVYMWLGALAADGPTILTRTMGVAFPIKDEDGEALLKDALKGSMDVLLAAGIDLASAETRQQLTSMLQLLRSAISSANLIHEGAQSGVIERASDKDLEYRDDLIGTENAEAEDLDDLRLLCVIALDRVEGLTVYQALDSGRLPLPDDVLSELRRWSQTNEPLALVWGIPYEEHSWEFQASGTGEEELRNLAEAVAAAAIANKTTAAGWTMAVSTPLAERLSQLAVAAAEKLGHSASVSTSGLDALSHKGLLNLAIEPGGQEVDINNVQIFDSDKFAEFLQLATGAVVEALTDLEDVDRFKMRAWQREDGSLLIREAESSRREVIVPSGSWRLLDASQLREAERHVAQAPERLYELLGRSITESIDSSNRRKESFEQVAKKSTSVVGLFGRGTTSLSALRTMIGNKPEATDTADRWLQSDHAFFLYWRAQDGRAASVIADDEAQLFSEVLDAALNLGDSPQSTLLYAVTDTSVDVKARAWWETHSGLLVTPVPNGH